MTGRTKEELSGITMLGNRNVQYPTDYAPEVLETFVNKHPDQPDSRTLPPSISAMFRT